jgi:alpha-tubulin suppressor-like RCC1 family protein
VNDVSQVQQIQSGNDSTAFVTGAGEKVKTWGLDAHGQLGNNDATKSSQAAPVLVQGLPTTPTDTVKWVDDGDQFYLALLTDGSVYGWGNDSSGQLGQGPDAQGNCDDQLVAQRVPVLPSDIVGIAAAAGESYALTSGGQVWAWGDNSVGQLGLGFTSTTGDPGTCTSGSGKTGIYTPQLITASALNDVSNPVWQISAGNGYAIAVLSDKTTVYAWGNNGDGQLGVNLGTSSLTPQKDTNWPPSTEMGSGGEITQISAGGNYLCDGHVLVLLNDGHVWAWGADSAGQLGNNSTSDPNPAAPVQPMVDKSGTPLTGASWITAGGFHSGALVGGVVYMWGGNDYGQVGNGKTPAVDQPFSCNNPASDNTVKIAKPILNPATGSNLTAKYLSAGSLHTASL